MNIFCMLLSGAAALPMCLFAQETGDSLTSLSERELELNEVIVLAHKPVLKQAPDRIIYLTKNDPYALGLNGLQVLDRIPRISVVNDQVSVAGKSSVRYIIDGHLLEMPDEAIALQLKNLQSSGIEKIELLTIPPAKYAASANIAYVSITTRNESLGTRGNLWGSGTLREDFSYTAGGSINHTTRKIELSADISAQDTRGINDLTRTYTFADYVRTSDRTNRFTNRNFGANGLFKYKFASDFSAGAIVNFSAIRFKSSLWDKTDDNGAISVSHTISPARPNNAITLTAFADKVLDSQGKTLSLTYNFFNRHIHSFSDVTTLQSTEQQYHLTDEGKNRYRIHSAKFDATLPFPSFKTETGAAYTYIDNNTALQINNLTDENRDNTFDYTEKTAAVYVSAEKNFTDSFFGKLGLRYEHTDVRGRQHIGNMVHNRSYGYLFPSLTLSQNLHNSGRLSLSYSMGITRPGFGDLNPFRYYSTVSDYFSGNPDLKPVTSHNAELNYSFKGLYAVIYNSYNHDAIGYITRFTTDGSQYTQPENCLNTNKTGLYASYNRSLFSWWNIKSGGEVYYSCSKSKVSDFREENERGWSGKLELNSSWMLNRRKTLILNFRFSHYFPRRERMVRYSAMSLIGCDVRYALFDNRLNLALSVNDPFGWNITKSKAYYSDYILNTTNNIHSHAVTFRIAWSLGRNKVNTVYRDSKERESQRSY